MKKQTRNIVISIIVSVCVTALLCVAGFNIYTTHQKKCIQNSSISAYADKLNEIKNIIDKYSIYDFDNEKASDYVYLGYVYGLTDDNYCAYYNKEDYDNTMSSRQGNFTGIGITVKNTGDLSNGLFVYRVLGNSPAEKAGIKNCDRIVNVEGTDLSGITYDDAVQLLLGEEGTSVKITVQRGEGDDVQNITYEISRTSFVQREVDYSIYNEIGYIRIYSFGTVAETEFKDALQEVTSQGVKGIVFDVRNNSGGNLTTVSNMLDMLMPADEPIIIIQSKDGEDTEYSTSTRMCDLPYAVLVNSSSASASELFSSTLRDVCNAKLIGTKTFGKGIGQTTYNLSDGTGIKLTTFRYLTKSRTDYNGIGLEPDVVCEISDQDQLNLYGLNIKQDVQFQQAFKVLSDNIEKGTN